MKLMKKMGFNGSRLGANEDGISYPIEIEPILRLRPSKDGEGTESQSQHNNNVAVASVGTFECRNRKCISKKCKHIVHIWS